MDAIRPASRSAATTAMVCSGLIGFQYVAAAVTRDVLFLSSLDASARPLMVGLSGVLWVLLATINFRLRRVALAVVVPATFGLSAALMLFDSMLAASLPGVVSRAFFLQTTALGPFLGACFWLVLHRMHSPRESRSSFGRVMGAGTLGGLMGALVAGRLPRWLGTASMLPILAVLSLVTGWLLWRLTRASPRDHSPAADESLRHVLGQLGRIDYVPILAAVLFLGATSGAFAEHLMNVRAQAALDAGSLPGFFSMYHLGVSVVGLVVQMTLATRAINALGLNMLMSSSSLVLAVGSIEAWILPGLAAVTVAYAGSSVVYDSFFKKAYEQFFTAVPPAERRAFKPIIDGLFSRLGASAGAALIWLLTLVWPARLYDLLLAATILCCGGAVLLARRTGTLYLASLERTLLSRAAELDLADVDDLTHRPVILRSASAALGKGATAAPVLSPDDDAELSDIRALRSRDRDAVLDVLGKEGGPPATLIPHIIPLLAWDPVSSAATRALRAVAEEHVGALVDALVDPNQPFAVRRRLPRVFAVCVSQRAVDGMLLGLDDFRFEVRLQCARALSIMVEKNPHARVDREHVWDIVRREVAVGRPVWSARRAIDAQDAGPSSFADDFVTDRAGQSLAHVFTLMSLVLPSTPLRIAYRGLHVEDRGLRDTTLEYLEGVLPTDVRQHLWEFLEEFPRQSGEGRSREAVLADLLRSSGSIQLQLEELRRRASAEAAASQNERATQDD